MTPADRGAARTAGCPASGRAAATAVPRSVAAAGDDDVAPREYRHGDDLRRVHWRSTARHGELMVRREEQQWQSRGALLLDTRRYAHRGEGPRSSFEVAVSAAASIGVQLGREGLGLRLVTDQGEVLAPSAAFEGALLDSLAVARTSPDAVAAARPVARSVPRRPTATAWSSACSGGSPPKTPRTWPGHAGAPPPASRCSSVTRSTRPPRAASTLRAAGWRVMIISSAAALAGAWAGADQAAENSELRAVRDRTAARPASSEAPAGRRGAERHGIGDRRYGRGEPRRTAMRLRLTIMAGLATLLASVGLYPLFESGGWFFTGLGAMLVVGGGRRARPGGSASRRGWRRWPGWPRCCST